ncbi:13091_t:CDS:2 [Dentiscutata heterogama]|uniref:13091_t:CDS:1 n=1 Tax=Dentiscutata heterogama TaxID=1316150 RepID=A0ACA9LHJ3_9GLOM|nr:13091_t:CDS:2 [Dentiscutata heterogama]
MVWCYCFICSKSEKVVSIQTERLHRQEEFGRIDHFIDNCQEETREPLLSTSQSFNLSISSAEDLTTSFLAKDSETETEQENNFKDSLSIRNTGLLDDIELEDSDIDEKTILSFKNTKTYT